MSKDIQQQFEQEHPGAKVTVLNVDDSGPYKVYDVVIRQKLFTYNSQYPENNRCLCGHAYYRHFDPYENWDAVGCKYCACKHFVHEVGAPRMSPFDRAKQFGHYSVALDDYILQWEMFGHAFYPAIESFLGNSIDGWTKQFDFKYPGSSSFDPDEMFVEC